MGWGAEETGWGALDPLDCSLAALIPHLTRHWSSKSQLTAAMLQLMRHWSRQSQGTANIPPDAVLEPLVAGDCEDPTPDTGLEPLIAHCRHQTALSSPASKGAIGKGIHRPTGPGKKDDHPP